MDFRRYLRLPSHLAVFMAVVIGTSVLLTSALFFGGIAGGFLAMYVLPGLVLYAAAILIFHLYQLARLRDWGTGRRTGGVFAILCLAPIVFLATAWLSNEAFRWGTFAAGYRGYLHVIALAESKRLPSPGKTAFQTADNGTEFQAERKAPYRIAFPMPGGFLNRWQGVVYDPEGIGKHQTRRQKDGSMADLFDDWWTVEVCSPMIGRFYICAFT